jgi:SagB-type dehydrogenase family enzyme
MARSKEADLARLYHLHSCHLRGRPLEADLDGPLPPLRHRSYPDAARTALPGRDFAVGEALGAVLERRRSIREYALRPLPLETLGRLLHASYGVRGRRRLPDPGAGGYERPAPSAGGLYPIELYVAAQRVEGLDDGVHHYDARSHELERVRPGLFHETLVELTMGQDMIRAANLVFILTAVVARTTYKYGQRGYRYVLLDAGHLGENLYLTATALGLGPAGIGGFLDVELSAHLSLPAGEEAVYLLCVGQPR